jgi:lactoylglutathione lyase
MKIEHIALWVNDIEKMREFYSIYFKAEPSEKYFNPLKQFSSYFLSFEDGTRLEIMNKPGLESSLQPMISGWAHIAMSVGSKEAVDDLTDRLRSDGYTIAGEPRTTGDGYYESVILDPEGNQIEITV